MPSVTSDSGSSLAHRDLASRPASSSRSACGMSTRNDVMVSVMVTTLGNAGAEGIRTGISNSAATGLVTRRRQQGRDLGPARDPEFGIRLVQVVGDGAGAEEQLGGDVPVRHATGRELDDLELLRGEDGEYVGP